MLTQLLQLVEQNQGELDLRALSQQLGSAPSAVAGMVETLVSLGRLVEVGPECGFCEACGLRDACQPAVKRARRFRVARPGAGNRQS